MAWGLKVDLGAAAASVGGGGACGDGARALARAVRKIVSSNPGLGGKNFFWKSMEHCFFRVEGSRRKFIGEWL